MGMDLQFKLNDNSKEGIHLEHMLKKNLINPVTSHSIYIYVYGVGYMYS